MAGFADRDNRNLQLVEAVWKPAPDAAGPLEPCAAVGVWTLFYEDGHRMANTSVYGQAICVEGEVVRTAPVPHELSDPAFAAEALHGLLGEQDQVPPAYSAISVNGRRAYALARDGKQVELAARHVTVHAAELVSVESGEKCVWTCAFDVSKGTYVRSLARDLGERLGTCAHLCGLVRTQAGGVCLGDCVDLDELAEGGKSLVVERCLDPVALLGLPRRDLALGELADVSCGRKIEVGEVFAGGERREPRPEERVALVFDGALAGIWERRGTSLACQTNFPQAIEGVN